MCRAILRAHAIVTYSEAFVLPADNMCHSAVGSDIKRDRGSYLMEMESWL